MDGDEEAAIDHPAFSATLVADKGTDGVAVGLKCRRGLADDTHVIGKATTVIAPHALLGGTAGGSHAARLGFRDHSLGGKRHKGILCSSVIDQVALACVEARKRSYPLAVLAKPSFLETMRESLAKVALPKATCKSWSKQ